MRLITYYYFTFILPEGADNEAHLLLSAWIPTCPMWKTDLTKIDNQRKEIQWYLETKIDWTKID